MLLAAMAVETERQAVAAHSRTADIDAIVVVVVLLLTFAPKPPLFEHVVVVHLTRHGAASSSA